MTAALSRPRPWRRPPTAVIEAVCVLAALAAGVTLLTLLPYDDIIRSLLCFRFHAGHGCAA